MITPGEYRSDALGNLPQPSFDSWIRRVQSGCLHPPCVVIGVLETGVAQMVKDRYTNKHQPKAIRWRIAPRPRDIEP
jgi:hypothetical protein